MRFREQQQKYSKEWALHCKTPVPRSPHWPVATTLHYTILPAIKQKNQRGSDTFQASKKICFHWFLHRRLALVLYSCILGSFNGVNKEVTEWERLFFFFFGEMEVEEDEYRRKERIALLIIVVVASVTVAALLVAFSYYCYIRNRVSKRRSDLQS